MGEGVKKLEAQDLRPRAALVKSISFGPLILKK